MSAVPLTGDVVAALDVADGVEGWLTREQGRALYDAAARCPRGGQIVEIGSFRGRSTIVLALAADPNVRVVAIDPHAGNDRGPGEIEGFGADADDDLRAFRANLADAGVADRVTHLRVPSAAAHPLVAGGVDVLYVDGAHRYRPASEDLGGWGDRVVDGGTMLVHDAFSSIGVTAAIARHLLFGTRHRFVGRSGSLASYVADLPPDGRSRLRNAGAQAMQLPWFARNIALKILLTCGGRWWWRARGHPEPEWPY